MKHQTIVDTNKNYGKMKKEELDHLVSTFFDNKTRRSKKKNVIPYISAATAIVVIVFIGMGLLISKNPSFTKAFLISPDKQPIEVRYNFGIPGKSKMRTVSFDLENIDASQFDFLVFSVRKEEKSVTDSSIRIQLENELQERDTAFVSGISETWKEFRFPLMAFKQINDWTSLSTLTFIVEEWNVASHKDGIFIDEVRFLQK